MASIIRIKRSTTAGDPSTLGNGELAYSAADSSVVSGGDRLYIGSGSETAGNAATHIVVGGKFFTDMLDHAKGTLTANSAIITDANSKIDNLKVDNLDLNGNTISSTNTNGDVNITPNGTGKSIVSNLYTDESTSLLEFIQDATGGQVVAGEGIDVTYDDNAGTVTVSAEDATDTNKGIASFNTTDFSVAAGAVSLNAERVQDIVGDMVSTNSESGISVTYDDTNGKLDFNVNDPLITISGDVDGSATMTNLGDTTISVTLDTVNTNVGSFGSATSIPTITVNSKGLVNAVTTNSITTSLGIAGDTGTDTIALATDTLTFSGGEGIDTAINSETNTITISAEDATTSNKGVASFADADFNVTSGAVELKDTVVKGFTVDAGAAVTPSGHSVQITGGEGVDVTVSGAVITVTGEDASSSNKGIASFSTAGFSVTAGNVALSDTVVQLVTTDSGAMNMANNAITIVGGEGVDVTHTGTTITVGAEIASSANLGVASFNTADFNVTAGDVTIKTAGVGNAQLENSSVTIGSTTVSLGGTSTTLAGLQQLDVDNIRIDGNEISSTNTNGNISLNPNGTGVVDVNNSRITSLADPTGAQDAATKSYVDSVAEGLAVKPAVRAATTANLTATYDNGTSGVGATLTIAATASLNIDGVTDWAVGNGILVKDQTNPVQNGRYFVSTVGNISTAWVLTRCSKCDEPTEIPSMYVFVQEGTVYASTGWVASVEDSGDFDVGVDDITFIQFSGAGTYLAGDALGITGSTFNVLVAAAGGIEISADALQIKSSLAGTGLDYSSGVLSLESTIAGSGLSYTSGVIDLSLAASGGLEVVSDALQLKSTVAGAGLTLTSGVLDIVGTANRITVNSDSVDIASTYVGQNSITTLGTITTGTWDGSTIAANRGGTGLASYAIGDLLVANSTTSLAKLTIGASGTVLQSNGTTLVYGDIDGGTYA